MASPQREGVVLRKRAKQTPFTMARVKLGISDLNAVELASKAQAVHDAVVANAAAFPNPLPPPPICRS